VYLNSGTNYTVLASLNILQDSNIKVYVGVEKESQREYLQKNYPKVSHINIIIYLYKLKYLCSISMFIV